MNVKFFVDEKYIPDDGSRKIISILDSKICDKYTEVYIFPDVHYKKGARVVNGLLIKSAKYIFPACLGVANCGFTFGIRRKDNSDTDEKIINEIKKISENYFYKKNYSEKEILIKLTNIIEKEYEKEKELFHFLKYYDVNKLTYSIISFLKKYNLMKKIKKDICVLGGGNHFCEVHKIQESIDENLINHYLFIVHSDSISVGDHINLIYSNLSELDFLPFRYRMLKKTRYRMIQLGYFSKNGLIFKDFKNVCKLIFSQKDYRCIDVCSPLGKNILFAHSVASLFGELNRQEILSSFDMNNEEKIKILGSHSHDSITIEKYDETENVLQRNGVQKIGHDPYFVLPNAMGQPIYIFKNAVNENCFFSANHGTGRISDKNIARKLFSETETEEELEKNKIKLFRVGNGNLAEQNAKAFKNIDIIANEMERNHMGTIIAKTNPIAIIKG